MIHPAESPVREIEDSNPSEELLGSPLLLVAHDDDLFGLLQIKIKNSQQTGKSEGILLHRFIKEPQGLLNRHQIPFLSRIIIEPKKGLGRHGISRRDRMVITRFGPRDQGLMVTTGKEESS